MPTDAKFRENLNLRLTAVRDHPRSMILVPIESAYATSHYSLIVTLVLLLSCTVSEIRRLIGWKCRIVHIPLSFGISRWS